jgi:hypothetical protein
VWFYILKPDMKTEVGHIKFTTDNTKLSINLDQNEPYVLRFWSVEGHFGGYSNCATITEVTPIQGENYSIIYSTAKSSCSTLLKKSVNGSDFTKISETQGQVGGLQFHATVTRQ